MNTIRLTWALIFSLVWIYVITILKASKKISDYLRNIYFTLKISKKIFLQIHKEAVSSEPVIQMFHLSSFPFAFH